MTKLVCDTSTSQLIAQISLFAAYIRDQLGYEEKPDINLDLTQTELVIRISATDKFMSKLDYGDRYQLSIWENAKYNESFDDLIATVWEQLRKHQPRAARELRYSLICLGKITESEQDLESAIARSIFADIKAIKNQLSEQLLEYNPEQTAEFNEPIKPAPRSSDIQF